MQEFMRDLSAASKIASREDYTEALHKALKTKERTPQTLDPEAGPTVPSPESSPAAVGGNAPGNVPTSVSQPASTLTGNPTNPAPGGAPASASPGDDEIRNEIDKAISNPRQFPTKTAYIDALMAIVDKARGKAKAGPAPVVTQQQPASATSPAPTTTK